MRVPIRGSAVPGFRLLGEHSPADAGDYTLGNAGFVPNCVNGPTTFSG